MTECERLDSVRSATSGAAVSDDLAVHLDACASCRRIFEAGKLPLDVSDFEVLPDEARQRILLTLAHARGAPRRRLALGLAAAASALLLWIAGGRDSSPTDRPAEAVAQALVEDHIRYLDHPDRQTGGSAAILERTLTAYVDFPVRLPVAASGRLTGARRCFLLGRRVALGFYESAGRPVSYFVLPAEGLTVPGRGCPGKADLACSASRGYHVVAWESGGLLYAWVGADKSPVLEMAKESRTETHKKGASS